MITETKIRHLTEPDARLARRAAEIALEGFTAPGSAARPGFRSDPVWAALRRLGTELWLDTGDLDEARALWSAEFSNLTTNNTLVNNEVQKGIFDSLIPEAARALRDASPGIDVESLVFEVGFILNCRTALRLVEALDATVSVELHPAFADDVATSVAYGLRYFSVCPERFIIKVPLTPAGYVAARKLSWAGVPVNFTLGFSARQNYLAARLSRPRFVNVFMGRLNAFVIDNELGDGRYVGEKATLATQRAVRQVRAASPEPHPTRLIGASMREASQVRALAGLDVFTMPTKVARDFHQEMVAAGPPAAVSLDSQMDREFEVELSSGHPLEIVGLDALWDLSPRVVALADAIERDEGAGPDVASAREAGLPGLCPLWTPEDRAAAKADGKIPVYSRWTSRLAAREVGLDALMSLSALYAFVHDQEKLDDRIRGLLA